MISRAIKSSLTARPSERASACLHAAAMQLLTIFNWLFVMQASHLHVIICAVHAERFSLSSYGSIHDPFALVIYAKGFGNSAQK